MGTLAEVEAAWDEAILAKAAQIEKDRLRADIERINR